VRGWYLLGSFLYSCLGFLSHLKCGWQAEQDLRVAQAEFDRQAEITKLLLEGVSSSHASHLRALHEFVEAQAAYYQKLHEVMQELQKDLTRYVLYVFTSACGPTVKIRRMGLSSCAFSGCRSFPITGVSSSLVPKYLQYKRYCPVLVALEGSALWGNTLPTALSHDQNWTVPFGLIVG